MAPRNRVTGKAQSGSPAYLGADACIKLGTDDAATRYQVNYGFCFPDRAPIQAL